MCYNESGEDQLEAFTEELEKEGKLSEDTKVLMKEITEKKPTKEKTADQTNNIKVSRDDWRHLGYIYLMHSSSRFATA